MDNPELSRSLRLQAASCRNLGSPFHGDLLDHAAEDLEAGGPVAAVLTPWAQADLRKLFDDAMPLRLLGGLHDLVLSGDVPALAATYPRSGRGADAALAWIAARAAIIRHQDRLAAFMTHEPQTNEVRRSVCLAPGLLTLAQETGLPMRTFEIAASAGLNLNWDRYRYRFGDVAWGDPAARVAMDTEWTGGPPPVDAPVEVIARAACDRRPVDLTDPVQRRRLLAYIWPDQFERMDRIRSAIDLALALEVTVEAADAVAWTARVAAPQAGAVTVLYHSVFWQYMPADSQAALARTIAEQGARARPDAPFAWLRMEPAPDQMTNMEVRLTLWPGGQDRVLAEVHPHGAWVKWLN
ncbi:DUF2332 domain-containing protein [Phenylobacterium sp.]|uniref:DUF2332 domain-containing protein n=1 Tax=Phenylobacterium sp. TaxID=1871053 RepID=UPI003BAB47D2